MTTNPLTIAVIVGTTRLQRESIHVARLVAEHGRQLDSVHIELVDPADFNLPGDGNDPEGKDPRYTALTEAADGFFIVTPEYNHSYPGSLKRLLDSELANYIHKPVAFATCSAQFTGGVRAVEALLSPVREMGLVATSYDVYFPRVADMFDGQGQLKAEHHERYDKSIGRAYQELTDFARLFKAWRENRGDTIQA